MLQKQIELTRLANFHTQTQAKSFSEPLQEHHLTQMFYINQVQL